MSDRIDSALSWLEGHVNLEAMTAGTYRVPTLDRITHLCHLLGDPQHTFPTIHVTGTNGKGSVARMVSELLAATGLKVGTYTSPDLERINERIAVNEVSISDEDLAAALEAIEVLEGMLEAKPSRFEILTAAAFRYFSDFPVDVGVIEVGMGGKWDATNIISAAVSVVTNISLDHTEILGPTTLDISKEKSGIIKPSGIAVIGETDPECVAIFESYASDVGSSVIRVNRDFEAPVNEAAVGGRRLSLRTPMAEYEDLFLSVHGPHQGDNALVALCAVESFFGNPPSQELVEDAFSALKIPGRLEVVSRDPLILIDGAHNPAGMEALAAALREEFSTENGRVVVMGALKGRDPSLMLEALDPKEIRLVIACSAPSPRSLSPSEIASAAAALGIDSVESNSISDAVELAVKTASDGEMIVVTGSMYVVGAARTEIMMRSRAAG